MDYQSLSEVEVRIQLAAAYRLIDQWGMAELIYNHISARVPGSQDQFLINPFGLRYGEIKASNLVKVDVQGQLVDAKDRDAGCQVNLAGSIIHRAIHQHRPEAACIVHTHTVAGMAIASLEEGLVPLTQEALRFHHQVGYHSFRGIVLNPEEQEGLVRSLGDKKVLILNNHGLLTVGPSIPQAVVLMYYLERACQVQLAVQATSREALIPLEKTAKHTCEQHWNKVEQLDDLVWPALIRDLDKNDPEYRD